MLPSVGEKSASRTSPERGSGGLTPANKSPRVLVEVDERDAQSVGQWESYGGFARTSWAHESNHDALDSFVRSLLRIRTEGE